MAIDGNFYLWGNETTRLRKHVSEKYPRCSIPANTKVHRTFQALKREGKSVSSAAKIAQSVTGQALATGRPPKHKGKSGR